MNCWNVLLREMKRAFAATGGIQCENAPNCLHRSLDRTIAVLDGRAAPLPKLPAETRDAKVGRE